jgi:hypothetical protein
MRTRRSRPDRTAAAAALWAALNDAAEARANAEAAARNADHDAALRERRWAEADAASLALFALFVRAHSTAGRRVRAENQHREDGRFARVWPAPEAEISDHERRERRNRAVWR